MYIDQARMLILTLNYYSSRVMESDIRANAGTVDPELQESISSLVAALGGADFQTHEYKLGDEALDCLRDLRKWLQFYDAKYDRLEVSCAIANTTLVENDIPEILGRWEMSLRKKKDAYLDRIALACLELLVPLTWPIDIIGKEGTSELFSQSLFLKQAQIKYKTAILTHTSHAILKAMIRIAARQKLEYSFRDRDPLEDGVLTLICSFFRNLVAISTGDDDDRSITLSEYSNQKVLKFLVSLAASLGSQIDSQDTLILETLYYLLRGSDPTKAYGVKEAESEPLQDVFKQDLKTLLSVEEEMNRTQFKPSRHSRFGTMIAMNEGGGDSVSVSGQRGVASMESTLNKLTESKRWNKPKSRGTKDELDKLSYMPSTQPVNSDPGAMKLVRQFASDFLDSSLNPLIAKLRKQIDRQQPRIHNLQGLTQYSYIVGWFLEASRARAKSENREMDFMLVGEILSTPSISTSLELLRKSLELGELRNTDLAHACMVSLREIITCIQSMSYSPIEELRDAADGVKARLFYDDNWLNMLATIPRTSKNKSIAYACETVALTHIVLKTLEAYSKQYTVVYVKNKHASKKRDNDEDDYDGPIGDDEAQRKSIRVTNERKFSYEKFLMKYVNENTIVTYERILGNFREVSQESILQVFSFLRRTFAKTSAKALFYRISLMHLLLELTDHHGLLPNSKAREVAKEFLRYYIHKFATTAAQLPSLHIQANVIMTPSDAFYYDHAGVDKVKFKPPKHEWRLRKRALTKFSPEIQFAILVAALVDSGKEGSLKWVEDQVLSVMNNTEISQNIQGEYFTTDREKIKMIHNDGLLRLLLRTLGLFVDTTSGQIRFPTDIDELDLVQKLEWLSKYQKETVEFEQGKVASDYIAIDGGIESDDEDEGEEENSNNFMSLRERLYNIGDGTRANGNKDGRDSSNKRQKLPKFNALSPAESEENLDDLSEHDDSLADKSDEEANNNEQESEAESTSAPKRSHSLAFDINVSDGEDEIPDSITSFTRRKLFVDDEDEDED